MQHDFDSIISSVSGQGNYMEALTKLIGNIQFCDLNIYKSRRDAISSAEQKLINGLNSLDKERIAGTELNFLKNNFISQSQSIDIPNKSVILYKKKLSKKASQKRKNRPPREIVAPEYIPKQLVKSDWFHSVKQLHKLTRKYLSDLDFNVEITITENYLKIIAFYNENPIQRDIKNFVGYVCETEDDLKNILAIRDASKEIIELLLEPMYDYKETIRKNWHLIDNIFRQNTNFNPYLVQDVLGKFTVAKYRCEIFDTTKYYMRLFGDVLSSPEVVNGNGDLDGAKFMDVIDAIDLDKFDKSANTYKFISAATPIMRKLVDPNCKESMDDILNQINNAIAPPPDMPAIEENENQSENNDIF